MKRDCILPLLTMLVGLTTGTDQNCDYKQKIDVGITYYVYNPEYPANYLPDTSCRWQAESPLGTNISLDCNVEFPSSDNCTTDRLTVSFPGDLDNYCGYGKVIKNSDLNKMNIVLTADHTSTGGKFICKLKVISPPPECICGWRHTVKSPPHSTRMVGGIETGVNEYPMMAGLVDSNLRVLYCGATIISKRYVLTAAHCLLNRLPSEVAVLVGDHDLTTGADTESSKLLRAKMFNLHPQFDESTWVNNIAIVSVLRDFTFSKNVGPVCLPGRYLNTTFTGQPIVLGWGSTSYGGSASKTLQQRQVTVILLSKCKAAYPKKTFTANQICTNACQSESEVGGPLLWEDAVTGHLQLVGIISGSSGCTSGKPGVNTRVGSYIRWIKTIINDDGCIK